jgi:D-lactate dehydrogenase
MKPVIAFFSVKPYDVASFEALKSKAFKFEYFEAHLTLKTVALAKGAKAVCTFVNDTIDAPLIEALKETGVELIVLRCAGFNQVDMEAATNTGIRVFRVPAYSPYAVAEHAVALIMTLNRKTHKAYNRVRDGNFLIDGLVGSDIHGKTVGVVGTGKIGEIFAGIMKGFGCKLLAFDPHKNPAVEAMGATYCTLEKLYKNSDIISLHCPLMPKTLHLIDDEAVKKFKPGMMLINTSRGGLIETTAVIKGLKNRQIGYLGLDVYEEEADLFFEDMSGQVIQDDTFSRLLTFPNVLVTGHQAFLTQEALKNIAKTTLENLEGYFSKKPTENEVKA